MNERPHIQTFEQRVASALTDEITSDDLATVLDELEAAINQGDTNVEVQRQTALDPLLSPNAEAARETVESSAFAVERLRTLLPRLEKRYGQVRDSEDAAVWNEDADRVEAKLNDIATEVKNTYPEISAKLVDLFSRVDAVASEINKIHHTVPNGVRRRLHLDPQLAAIAKALQLPDFADATRMLWPKPQPSLAVLVAESMSPAAHPHGRWWEGIEARNSDRQQESRRVTAYYERQQREVEEREAAEAAALKERDEQQRAERYGRRT